MNSILSIRLNSVDILQNLILYCTCSRFKLIEASMFGQSSLSKMSGPSFELCNAIFFRFQRKHIARPHLTDRERLFDPVTEVAEFHEPLMADYVSKDCNVELVVLENLAYHLSFTFTETQCPFVRIDCGQASQSHQRTRSRIRRETRSAPRWRPSETCQENPYTLP